MCGTSMYPRSAVKPWGRIFDFGGIGRHGEKRLLQLWDGGVHECRIHDPSVKYVIRIDYRVLYTVVSRDTNARL